MASGKSKVVSEEYKSALQDLTFNSKPMINVLTMLADENNDYGQAIMQVICERIKDVNIEQKMPALYLLDSILKNIGGDYVSIISKNIVDVFAHVFDNALDERLRMQLFKLRNTWNQYIPTKTLYELDVRVSKTDRNWPVTSPVGISSSSVAANANQKIHVNPKFLQKPEVSKTTTNFTSLDKEDTGATQLQSKIIKQRLLEEEKRVQEQLKLLQAEKLKKDREKHEMELKQQQLERERVLVEQKRQLEVLRKQQQSIAADKKVLTTEHSSFQEKKKIIRSSTISDPRKKMLSPSKEVRVNTKVASKVPSSKNTSPKAVNVLNKIMTSLSTKKTKQSLKQLARSTQDRKPDASAISKPSSRNNDVNKISKTCVTGSDKSSPTFSKSVKMSVSDARTKSENVINNTKNPLKTFKPNERLDKETIEAGLTTSAVSSATTETISLPPSSMFSQLSTRDMQIAAQAAAIATAMHQMQTGSAALAPEQSALIAAQLIKVMQGGIPASVASLPVSVPQTSVPNAVAGLNSVSTSSPTPESSQSNMVSQTVASSCRTKIVDNLSNEFSTGVGSLVRQETSLKESDDKEMSQRESKTAEKRQRGKFPSIDLISKKRQDRSKSPQSTSVSVSSTQSESNSDNSRGRNRKDSDSKKDDYTERSRKARARSPSRYYCRVEKKMEVEKRVEKKEKELVLQRMRKESDGDKESVRRLSESLPTGDHCEIELDNDLDDGDFSEADKNDDTKTANSLKDSAVISPGVKPEKMTDSEWEALKKIRMKEFIILRTRVRDLARQQDENRAPLGPLVIARYKEECQSRFKEGKLSTEQTDHLFQQVNQLDVDPLHWRQRSDVHHGLTALNSNPRLKVAERRKRQTLPGNHILRPPHPRDGPSNFRDIGTRIYDEKLLQSDRSLPQQLREDPHCRHYPEEEQGLSTRDEIRPQLRAGMPPRVRDVSPQFRNRLPLPQRRDGPLHPHVRENSLPSHSRDDLPPLNLRDRLPPTHTRGRPPPAHMRERHPPHTMEAHFQPRYGAPEHLIGPRPSHLRDARPLPRHMRDDCSPYLRDDSRAFQADSLLSNQMHMKGPRPLHGEPTRLMDGLRPPADQFVRPPHGQMYRNSPPPPGIFPSVCGAGPTQSQSDGVSQPAPSRPVDVNDLLGQLLAAGMISKQELETTQKEIPVLDAPLLKLQIDTLRKRHQSVINNLFQGLQCSSCGQRFPEDLKKQYSNHLDWHFRQNRKEKDGSRKTSSRTWYYDIHDWIEHVEVDVTEDRNALSKHFELERSELLEGIAGDLSDDTSLKKSKKKVKDHSVPVSEDDSDGMCLVCLERLEQYWDEEQEEWRFKDAVRENGKTYHHYCFTDHVPFEFEDVTTPMKTSGLETPAISTPENVAKSDEEEASCKVVNTTNEERKDVIISCDPVFEEKVEGEVTVFPTVKDEPLTTIKTESAGSADLPEVEAPDSPEFPVISSTTNKLLTVTEPVLDTVVNETSLGRKRPRPDSPANEIPAKEAKLLDSPDSLRTSVDANDLKIVNTIIKVEPNVTMVQPNVNISD